MFADFHNKHIMSPNLLIMLVYSYMTNNVRETPVKIRKSVYCGLASYEMIWYDV